jgi:hypothetical protein
MTAHGRAVDAEEARDRQSDMARGRRIVLPLVLGAVAVVVPLIVEYRFGYVTGYRVPGAPMVRSPSLRLAVKQALGLQAFYSQLGQDKWIIGRVYPGVSDGYFADIGSWDAEIDSNSKALETLGWTGICIDPFPENWRDRTCRLFKEVLYNKKGEVIRFTTAGQLGGIQKHLGMWQEAARGFPVVEFETTTIGDVLERVNAPKFIHYVSIDTEGSEFEILSALPFDEYTVGAFTIEHNLEEPKRQKIRRLLESKGYKLMRTQLVDDWYVLEGEGRAQHQ